MNTRIKCGRNDLSGLPTLVRLRTETGQNIAAVWLLTGDDVQGFAQRHQREVVEGTFHESMV